MSKIANALFTLALQSRMDRDGVKIVCAAVDPGFVDTGECRLYVLNSADLIALLFALEGIRNVTIPSIHKGFRMVWAFIVAASFIPASKGAYAQLFASTSPQLQSSSHDATQGKLKGGPETKLLWVLPNCRIGSCPNPSVCEDVALAEELWAGSLKVLEEIGVKCDDLPV